MCVYLYTCVCFYMGEEINERRHQSSNEFWKVFCQSQATARYSALSVPMVGLQNLRTPWEQVGALGEPMGCPWFHLFDPLLQRPMNSRVSHGHRGNNHKNSIWAPGPIDHFCATPRVELECCASRAFFIQVLFSFANPPF